MFSIFTPAFTFKNRGASPSESITGYVTGSDKLLVPGKVIASNNIAQGSMTLPIEPSKLFGKPDVVQVSVTMSAFGTLMLDSKSDAIWSDDIHWVRAIRLSDDCHNYNIQLKLKPSQRISNSLPNKNTSAPPQLILQVVRPILAGQELLLWFSEDILAMLQIAFLTPANIQGQKEYVCLRCGAMYESPNPLKLHITLNCGLNPVIKLWNKLCSILTNNTTSEILEGDIFDFKLVPETSLTRQKIAMDLTTSTSRRDCLNSITHRPFLENSAFKPFKRSENHVKGESGVQGSVSWPLNVSNLTSSGNMKEDEAQIESLVSSLGKTKQGHMCVYCGKCYSRKYGLKIHIRTHTGYKPLECKYCKRPFGDPSNLNKHVRLHAEGNTPYRCDLCGKVLVRRRDLERHLKSRHLPETHPDMNLIVSRNSEEEVDDVEKLPSSKTEESKL